MPLAFCRSRSLKVNENGMDCSATCDFQLVIHSNHWLNSYRFSDVRQFQRKTLNYFIPCCCCIDCHTWKLSSLEFSNTGLVQNQNDVYRTVKTHDIYNRLDNTRIASKRRNTCTNHQTFLPFGLAYFNTFEIHCYYNIPTRLPLAGH